MPNTFKKVNLSVVGKFEDADKFPGWLRYHGGEMSKKISSRVTHLVASEEAFRGDAEPVRQARELGIHIVHHDWLYDSLSTKPARPKPVASYLWQSILQPEMRPDLRPRTRFVTSVMLPLKGRKPVRDPFIKKKDIIAKERIYIDVSKNEVWDVCLQRITATGKREKFRLAIFESLVQDPPTYSAYVKYSRVGKAQVDMVAPLKSNLNLAQQNFKKFFKLQTGVEWEERVESKHIPPKQDEQGNVLPTHQGWYTFSRPSVLSEYMSQPMQKAQALSDEAHHSPTEPGDGLSIHSNHDSEFTFVGYTEDSGCDGDLDSGTATDGGVPLPDQSLFTSGLSSDIMSGESGLTDTETQRNGLKSSLKRKACERDSEYATEDDETEGYATEMIDFALEGHAMVDGHRDKKKI